MRATLDRSSSSLVLTFDDLDAVAAFAKAIQEQKGFLVPLAQELPQFETFRVTLADADGFAFSFDAEVAQVFASAVAEFGTAFLLEVWDGAKQRSFDAQLARARATAESANESESLGASPLHRIKKMNTSQRAVFAMRAGRTERQILLRDTSPQVLEALLSNPRLEGREVLQLVKSTHSVAPVLQRIAGDARWGKTVEVATAIARNPKTPSPLAMQLMERLRTPDLRVMAKMGSGLREIVRKAALREYLRRTGNR